MLINAKADLRIVDTFGNNIMHYAVAKQKASCVELLLEHGAGLHAKNNDGLTPVDMTEKEFLPTLQALIEKYKRAGGQAESKVSDRKKVSKRDGEENKSTRLESGKSQSRSIQISTISVRQTIQTGHHRAQRFQNSRGSREWQLRGCVLG